jgi:hypothetical protein
MWSTDGGFAGAGGTGGEYGFLMLMELVKRTEEEMAFGA